MTVRRWSDVKADAMARQPWLASAEAKAARAEIRAENLGRIRGHELAEMRKSAGLTQADVARALGPDPPPAARSAAFGPEQHA